MKRSAMKGTDYVDVGVFAQQKYLNDGGVHP
jgi:hypothetical protein